MIFKSCEICQKSFMDDSFLKSPDAVSALYWANKYFHKIPEDIVFCGPEHSLQWYQQNILKLNEKNVTIEEK